MSQRNVIIIAAVAVVATPVWAGRPGKVPGVQFVDQARVISATPVYEEFNEPRRECWIEQTGYRSESNRDRSYVGAVIGTVLGGIVGHQVGAGTGKAAATAVGAATGAIVGNSIDKQNRERGARRVPVEEERCRSVDSWSRRVTGYDVVYRYQGNDYSAFLPYDPGPTLPLKVNVSIAERW